MSNGRPLSPKPDGALQAATQAEQRLILAMETADIHVRDLDYVRGTLTKAGYDERFATLFRHRSF